VGWGSGALSARRWRADLTLYYRIGALSNVAYGAIWGLDSRLEARNCWLLGCFSGFEVFLGLVGVFADLWGSSRICGDLRGSVGIYLMP